MEEDKCHYPPFFLYFSLWTGNYRVIFPKTFIAVVKAARLRSLRSSCSVRDGSVRVGFNPPRCPGVGTSRVLGTGGGTQHTPPMVPRCLCPPFPGLKCGDQACFSELGVGWSESVYKQVYFFDRFSIESVRFLVCPHSGLAFDSWFLIDTLLPQL